MNEDRFKLLASVHILFLKDDNILLSLRKNISSAGLYGLVAGHLNGGETVTSAMLREAKEEVGVDILPEDIEIKTVCHSNVEKNDKEFIQFYVVCKKWDGELINNEPDKCEEIKFFPINNLPDNMVPYIRDAIGKVLSGTTYYEYGWNGKE
ncbi:NUDIX domain-containing protein [Patescibacteria group bacterium]|nr:NUDIX domain-containing protein [Patescibacteria group bacterium]MBU1895489.1 NUDIX domain-containing protein [Patescibacteria group bacterium]